MATVLLTCNRYRVLREVPFDADLPKLCAAAELEAKDGYAVVASRDGKLVADTEGYWPEYPMSAYERAEACFGEQP